MYKSFLPIFEDLTKIHNKVRFRESDTLPVNICNMIKALAKDENFLRVSDEILRDLGEGNIGTNEKTIIDKFISTPNNPVLEIKIYWPDDDPGHPKVFVGIRTKSTTQLKLRRSR